MKVGHPNLNRKFASGRAWKIWDGARLSEMVPGPVLFFDDPSLGGAVVEWYAGVEVHKKVLVVAIYGRAGETRVLGPILREPTTPAGRAALWGAVAPFAPARFLLETTGVYHVPVAWELRARFLGSQVVVMNAFELSKYVQRTRKNDKVDATRLAQIASVGELIRPSVVPDPAEWLLREQARYEGAKVSEVTRQKNRVKKVMSTFGWHWDVNFKIQGEVKFLEGFLAQDRSLGEFMAAGAGPAGKARATLQPWACVHLSRGVRELLLQLLRDLRVLEEIEALAKAQLGARVEANPQVKTAAGRLAEFPGLGSIEAMTFLAEVGNAARFPDAGRFLVYAGIAPAGGTSGVQDAGDAHEKVVARDRPNPRSNRRLRGILTRVAVAILRDCSRTSRKDDLYLYARSWKEQDVVKMRRVYKVAAKVGRKLFHVVTTGEAYNGEVEKDPAVAKHNLARSRQVRRRQAYRKEWEARVAAEQTAETLLALLRERGLGDEALAAIARASSLAGSAAPGDSRPGSGSTAGGAE